MFKFIYFMLFSGVICASHDYSLHISKEVTVVNNKQVFCACGKSPDCIMFFSGNPEYYCTTHVPEIERVRTIRPEDIQQLLASINQPKRNWNHQGIEEDIAALNMNGGHQGVENGK